MGVLKVTLACGPYDRTWELASGRVRPEGVDLNYINLPPEELFWRMTVHEEFDAAEFSLGAMTILLGRGDRRFVGIPVFPSRFFRHSSIFVNVHSGIKRPEDLKGMKVGVPDYTMTANTWIRGFLEHDHGVKPTDIHWFTAGLNEPGRRQRVETQPIKGLQITHSDTGILSEMLDNGEIDALIGAREPDNFRRRSPNVARLFPNYKQIEIEYFRRTGIFPIMHLIVLKREIYEEHPWLAFSLYKAFVESKEICAQEMSQQSALRYMLPWMIPEMEETIRGSWVRTTGPMGLSLTAKPSRPSSPIHLSRDWPNPPSKPKRCSPPKRLTWPGSELNPTIFQLEGHRHHQKERKAHGD